MIEMPVDNRSAISSVMGLALGVVAALTSVPEACAQNELLRQANEMVGAHGALVDVADRLFPAIVSMDPLPPGAPLVRDASILAPGSPAWPSWSAWAEAPVQQAIIDALLEVTRPEFRGVLGFPYGSEGIDSAWIDADLVVDLGRPAILARARDHMAYLDHFDAVAKLCTIEATRRAESGDAQGCVDVLLGWLGLARFTLERIFYVEKRWGMTHAIVSCERMCDIAFSYPELLDPGLVSDVTDHLDPRNLRSDRFQFPYGEQLAAQQLMRLTIEERGGPKPGGFAAIMGRVEAGQRGLLAFGGAAAWSGREASHAGWFDTEDEIQKVFGDWDFRWRLNNEFDPRMRLQSDFDRMDKARFAIIDRVASGLEHLFDLRMQVKVAITGTRSALGTVGYKLDQGQWPTTLAAVQPQFVNKLDNDPWNFDPAGDVRDIFQYFVPIRDQPRGPREDPVPHQIVIDIGAGETGLEGGPDGSRVDNGLFLPFTAQSFRDALKTGIPSRLWDRSADRVDVPGFKVYLKAQVGNLNIETQTMNALVAQIDSFSEAQVRSVIALVEGAGSSAGAEAPSENANEPEFTDQEYRDAVQPDMEFFRQSGETPQRMIEIMVAIWVTGRQQMLDALARVVDEETESSRDWARYPPLLYLAGVDEVRAEDRAQVNRTVALRWYLNEGFEDRLRQAAEIQNPTSDDVENLFIESLREAVEARMREVRMQRIRRAGRATIELDESDFVLYSVGPDARRQQGESVGIGGTDILIWPPLLSIQRGH